MGWLPLSRWNGWKKKKRKTHHILFMAMDVRSWYEQPTENKIQRNFSLRNKHKCHHLTNHIHLVVLCLIFGRCECVRASSTIISNFEFVENVRKVSWDRYIIRTIYYQRDLWLGVRKGNHRFKRAKCDNNSNNVPCSVQTIVAGCIQCTWLHKIITKSINASLLCRRMPNAWIFCMSIWMPIIQNIPSC